MSDSDREELISLAIAAMCCADSLAERRHYWTFACHEILKRRPEVVLAMESEMGLA